MDLEAVWTPIIYNINYVLNGGTNDSRNPATYTIEDNILTITGEGEYDFSAEVYNKEILVDASCTLNLNEFSLSNSGSLTPLLIS